MHKWLLVMVTSGLFSSHAFALVEPASEDNKPIAIEGHSVKADANGDGKVSLEEYKAARMKNVEQQFHTLDVNNDGFIDEIERNLAVEKLKLQLRQLREQKKQKP